MIHVPNVIFGQTTPTLYTVNGEPAVWVLDLKIFEQEHDVPVLRYTTLNGHGMMSVYTLSGDSLTVHADSDRTILCDPHGNPTSVTGIQRYMPASLFAPAYLEPGELWWRSTTGIAAHHPGDNYPDDGAGGFAYKHDNAWKIIDGVLYHDEEVFYQVADSPMSKPYWKLVYKRGFKYDVENRELLAFTCYDPDGGDARVYERS